MVRSWMLANDSAPRSVGPSDASYRLAVLGDQGRNVAAVRAVAHRRDPNRDRLAYAEQVRHEPLPNHIVAAVAFVLDITRAALVVGHFEDDLRVRIREPHVLHDAGDLDRVTEVELCGGVMAECRSGSRQSHRRSRERTEKNSLAHAGHS